MAAFVVVQVHVNNPEPYEVYKNGVAATLTPFGGKFLARGGKVETLEGDWKPERMVIIEFPEREKAEAFLGDPEIQDLFKVRHDTTTSKLVLADGCT